MPWIAWIFVIGGLLLLIAYLDHVHKNHKSVSMQSSPSKSVFKEYTEYLGCGCPDGLAWVEYDREKKTWKDSLLWHQKPSCVWHRELFYGTLVIEQRLIFQVIFDTKVIGHVHRLHEALTLLQESETRTTRPSSRSPAPAATSKDSSSIIPPTAPDCAAPPRSTAATAPPRSAANVTTDPSYLDRDLAEERFALLELNDRPLVRKP